MKWILVLVFIVCVSGSAIYASIPALGLGSGVYDYGKSLSRVEKPMLERQSLVLTSDTLPNSSSGSNIIYLDLPTVLMLGGANNLTIKEYQARHALALADATQAKEWWLPTIYAGGQINQLWGSAMNGDGRFFTDVNRQSFWGGVGADMSWDFGKGIHTSKAASLRAQAAKYATDAERIKTLREIVKTYYAFLVAQLSYQSYEALTSEADSIVAQLALQVEVGIRYLSEKLLAQSQASHFKVEALNARLEFEQRSAELVRQLNLDPNAQPIARDEAIVPLDFSSKSSYSLPIDSLYAVRPEIKRDELTLLSLEAEKKTITSGLLLPELRLNAYTSAFGDVFAPLYPTSAINAGLIWEVPLGRIVNQGELRQFDARIAMQENQLAQTKAAIHEESSLYASQLATYREQMELAKEGSQLARLALEQSIERQRLGTAKAFEVIQAQEIFIKLRLDYLKATGGVNWIGFWGNGHLSLGLGF